jgi:hypothetical protein
MTVYLLGTLFIEFSWDVCYLTTIESMPTPVRASALSACSSVARVANIAAAFVGFKVFLIENKFFDPDSSIFVLLG